ncbi:MAG: ABC transporter ATP-binding protein [Clostridia bacterium]|nr:ABC transporter ATP-binding protein [Clostridia bacterium]
MRLIFRYIRRFIGMMILGLLIKIIGTLMDLVLPYILAHIVDNVVPAGERNTIFYWGGIMIICSIIALVGNVIANRIAARVARDTTKSIRHDLFKKVMYLSSERLDKLTIPSLESRLTSDTFQIHRVVGMMQRIGVRAPILLFGGIALTLTLDPVLTLIMVATLPFIGITVYFVSRKGIPMFTEAQAGVDNMTRVVRENAQGIRVVKALSKTDYERRHFDDANRNLVRLEKKANLTMALTNPMMTLFLNIGLAGVILVGAYRVQGGLSEPGVIIAFMSYFTIVTNAMLTITRIFTMMSRGTASANRIKEVLDLEPDLPVIEKGEPAENDGYLIFEDVNFSYNKVKNNLSDINFSLPKGATLGIIGSTGSGKSTLIQLIMRYYDPDSGRILVDGKDVRAYKPEELHAKIGIVRQNDFLYNDTIEENIRFGRDISHEEIVNAAKIAQADGFINETEGGYSHMLTAKGTNVSGGQKQRLLIARALADSPELLILDDSSSALDYKTDATLRRAINENYSDTTTVIVAQRVSSIMNADLILVLENGEIIAAGKHDELMQDCDVYREISDTQLGGAILD